RPVRRLAGDAAARRPGPFVPQPRTHCRRARPSPAGHGGARSLRPADCRRGGDHRGRDLGRQAGHLGRLRRAQRCHWPAGDPGFLARHPGGDAAFGLVALDAAPALRAPDGGSSQEPHHRHHPSHHPRTGPVWRLDAPGAHPDARGSPPGLHPHRRGQGAGRAFRGHPPRAEERLHSSPDCARPAGRATGIGNRRAREHLRAARHGPLPARIGPGARLPRHPGPEPDFRDGDCAHQSAGRPPLRLARPARALLMIAEPATLQPVAAPRRAGSLRRHAGTPTWPAAVARFLKKKPMGAFGAALIVLFLALALGAQWLAPGTARVVRSAGLAMREQPYVESARCAGAGHARIVRSYVLPNVSAAILVLATTQLGVAVLAESTLSFLGYGVPPPFPTWGSMLSGTGRAFMLQSPWLSIWPGLAISAAVFGFNMLGDALRDVLDPRLRGR